ncbi:hypothetical protein E0D97_05375 [Oricola cellulosilytica]|uniref:Tetratricopeptide repeat protein n=1 Tax=Oricola cellulosilytica TaxID=1429082 RepID=A0A4R0PFP7_9HYPH|nr:hypothetical protein E0D97_05375 [Oricola cellulosilytica]
MDSAIIAADAAGDPRALSVLYGKAALALEQKGDIESACFFYTHAFVFALEAGSEAAKTYRAALLRHGRI